MNTNAILLYKIVASTTLSNEVINSRTVIYSSVAALSLFRGTDWCTACFCYIVTSTEIAEPPPRNKAINSRRWSTIAVPVGPFARLRTGTCSTDSALRTVPDRQSANLSGLCSPNSPDLCIVMSCMRVCRKQALSRVKYYYYTTISKIQQATILTV